MNNTLSTETRPTSGLGNQRINTPLNSMDWRMLNANVARANRVVEPTFSQANKGTKTLREITGQQSGISESLKQPGKIQDSTPLQPEPAPVVPPVSETNSEQEKVPKPLPKRTKDSPYTTITMEQDEIFFQDKSKRTEDQLVDGTKVTLEDVKAGKVLQEEIGHINTAINNLKNLQPPIDEFKKLKLAGLDGKERDETDDEYTIRIADLVEDRLRFYGKWKKTDDVVYAELAKNIPAGLDKWARHLQGIKAIRDQALDHQNEDIKKFNADLDNYYGVGRMRAEVGFSEGLVDLTKSFDIYGPDGKKNPEAYRDMMAGALLYERLMDLPYEGPKGHEITFRQKLENLQKELQEQSGHMEEFTLRKKNLEIEKLRNQFLKRSAEAIKKSASTTNPFNTKATNFESEAYKTIKTLQNKPDPLQTLLDHYFTSHPQSFGNNSEGIKNKESLTNRFRDLYTGQNTNIKAILFPEAYKGIDWMRRRSDAQIRKKELNKISGIITGEEMRQGGTYKEWEGHKHSIIPYLEDRDPESYNSVLLPSHTADGEQVLDPDLYDPFPTLPVKGGFWQDASSSEGDLDIDTHAVSFADIKAGRALVDERNLINNLTTQLSADIPALKVLKVKRKDGTSTDETREEHQKRIAKMVEKRLRFVLAYQGGKDPITGEIIKPPQDKLFKALQEAIDTNDPVAMEKYLQASRALYWLAIDRENIANEQKNREIEKSLGWSSMRVGVNPIEGGSVIINDFMPNRDAKGEHMTLPHQDMVAGALVYEYCMDLPYQYDAENKPISYREILKKLQSERDKAGTVKEFMTMDDRLEMYPVQKEFYDKMTKVMEAMEAPINPFEHDPKSFEFQALTQLRKLQTSPAKDTLHDLMDHYFLAHPETFAGKPEAPTNKSTVTKNIEESFKVQGQEKPVLHLFYSQAHKGIDWMERKMEIAESRLKIRKVPTKISGEKWVNKGGYKEWGGNEVIRQKPKVIKKKEAPPPVTPEPVPSAPTAPPAPVKPQLTQKEIETEVPQPAVNIPTRADIALTGIQQNIATGTQVPQEQGREMAAYLQTEEKEKYKGLRASLGQALPRFWKWTLNKTATYGKEASIGTKLVAEAGLGIHKIPGALYQEIDKLAQRNLIEKRRSKKEKEQMKKDEEILANQGAATMERAKAMNRLNKKRDKKLKANLKDVIQELGWHERDIHRERILAAKQLHDEALSDSENLSEGAKMMRQALENDFSAAEDIAATLTSEYHRDLVHRNVGEMRADITVDITGDAKKYLIDKIWRPMCTAGLSGNVPDHIKAQVRRDAKEFFFTKEFKEWYETQLHSSDPQVVEAAQKLTKSLTYGTNLIHFIEKEVLPKLRLASQVASEKYNLDEYLQEVVISARFGTKESGQREEINEGFYQKMAGIKIGQKEADAVYQKIGQEGINIAPGQALNEAASRATLLSGVAGFVTSHVVWGLGVYVGAKAIAGAANIVPVVGGAVTGGILRSMEEGSMTTREYEQYQIEDAMGDRPLNEEEAKRSAKMESIKRHKRSMEEDITIKLRSGLDNLEKSEYGENNANIIKLLANVADVYARLAIMDNKRILLVKSKDRQGFQAELTNMELAAARAKGQLRKLSPELLKTISHIDAIPEGQNAADYIISQLSTVQQDVIERGIGEETKFKDVLSHVAVSKEQTLHVAESRFQRMKLVRSSTSFLGVVAGGIGGYALVNNEFTKAAVAGAIKALDSIQPVHDFFAGAGWVRDEVAKKGARLADKIHTLVENPDKTMPSTKIPDGTKWVKISDGSYNLVDSSNPNKILYQNVTFDKNGQILSGTAIDSGVRVDKIGQNIGKVVDQAGKNAVLPTIDVDIINELKKSGHIIKDGISYNVGADHILTMTDVSGKPLIGTANKLIFENGKISYTSPVQNFVTSDFIDFFKNKLGIIIKETDFYPPRYTNEQWQDILSHLQDGVKYTGAVERVPYISAPPSLNFTGVREVTNPDSSGIGWLFHVRDNNFDMTDMLKNGTEATVIEGNRILLPSGVVVPMNPNTGNFSFNLGDKVIYSENDGNLMVNPKGMKLVENFAALKQGDIEAAKHFKFIIRVPGQIDSGTILVDVDKNGKFIVPDSLKNIVFDEKTGQLKANIGVEYFDQLNSDGSIAGVAQSLTGTTPVEKVTFDFLPMTSGTPAIKEVSHDVYQPIINWTEQKLVDDAPIPIRKFTPVDYDLLTLPFDWGRRPLERYEKGFAWSLPRAEILDAQPKPTIFKTFQNPPKTVKRTVWVDEHGVEHPAPSVQTNTTAVATITSVPVGVSPSNITPEIQAAASTLGVEPEVFEKARTDPVEKNIIIKEIVRTNGDSLVSDEVRNRIVEEANTNNPDCEQILPKLIASSADAINNIFDDLANTDYEQANKPQLREKIKQKITNICQGKNFTGEEIEKLSDYFTEIGLRIHEEIVKAATAKVEVALFTPVAAQTREVLSDIKKEQEEILSLQRDIYDHSIMRLRKKVILENLLQPTEDIKKDIVEVTGKPRSEVDLLLSTAQGRETLVKEIILDDMWQVKKREIIGERLGKLLFSTIDNLVEPSRSKVNAIAIDQNVIGYVNDPANREKIEHATGEQLEEMVAEMMMVFNANRQANNQCSADNMITYITVFRTAISISEQPIESEIENQEKQRLLKLYDLPTSEEKQLRKDFFIRQTKETVRQIEEDLANNLDESQFVTKWKKERKNLTTPENRIECAVAHFTGTYIFNQENPMSFTREVGIEKAKMTNAELVKLSPDQQAEYTLVVTKLGNYAEGLFRVVSREVEKKLQANASADPHATAQAVIGEVFKDKDIFSVFKDNKIPVSEEEFMKYFITESIIFGKIQPQLDELYRGKMNAAMAEIREWSADLKVPVEKETKDEIVLTPEKINSIEQLVDTGVILIKQGKYKEAFDLFKNQELATKLGITLSASRVKITNKVPDVNTVIDGLANIMASNSWYHLDSKSIDISDVLIITGNNVDYKFFEHGEYPQELMHEMALVGLEEWLHALQDKNRRPLVGIDNEEIDVAKYMLERGIKLTNDYLLRYDRGLELGMMDEVDDSMMWRPAFRRGTFVRININGQTQENWQIIGIDKKQGKIAVRDTNNKYTQMLISEEDLIVNNQNGVYPFREANNIIDLAVILRKLDNLYAGKQKFDAETVIGLIQDAMLNPTDENINKIPRSGGLRYKVTQLLKVKETMGHATTMINRSDLT